MHSRLKQQAKSRPSSTAIQTLSWILKIKVDRGQEFHCNTIRNAKLNKKFKKMELTNTKTEAFMNYIRAKQSPKLQLPVRNEIKSMLKWPKKWKKKRSESIVQIR